MRKRGLDFVLLGTDYSKYFIDKIEQCLQERGLEFSVGNISADYFPAGHRSTQLDEDVRGNEVWIVHSYLVGQPIISDYDLFKISDAAKRSSCERFTICTTYTEFRQDKKSDGRVDINAKLFADILKVAGGNKFDRFSTAHPHSEQVQGFFDVSFDSLPSIDVFEWYCKEILFPHLGIENPRAEVLVYSGDGGSVSVNRRLARRLGVEGLSLDKLRSIKSERNVSKSERPSNANLIYGKIILTLDDIMCSGGTGCDLAKDCLDLGAREFYELATHGLFSKKGGLGCEERVRAVENMKVITTDTVPRPKEYLEENKDWLIGYISMAPVYAELIYRTMMQESVSAMFRDPWDKKFNQTLRSQLLDVFDRFYKKPEYFINNLE